MAVRRGYDPLKSRVTVGPVHQLRHAPLARATETYASCGVRSICLALLEFPPQEGR